MKRSRPSRAPLSGGSGADTAASYGGGATIESILLVAVSCLLLTYGVITLRTFAKIDTAHTATSGGAADGSVRGGGGGSKSYAAYPITPPRATETSAATDNNAETSVGTSAFPLSIDSTPYETIVHPASEISSNRADNGERRVEISVPAFWDPPEYSAAGGIRQHLGQHGQHLITPQEASDVGSYIIGQHGQKLETIYIAIASYRDWQCTATVENIFHRAKHPERLRVALVDQVDADDAQCAQPPTPCGVDPDQILCKYSERIDRYEMDATLAVGPVFARHIGHRMYRGEYFAMQCDAHIKMVQDWDEDIVEQWKSANNEMAVLTTYLSDIQGAIDEKTGERLQRSRPIMCRTDYEGWGDERHLRHGQQPEGVPGIHGEPTLEPYWAAGFSFARGHFVVQVPYDQHLPMIFQGEEISIGLRGWTYGYDYYTPEKSVCFHMYAVGKNKSKRKRVKLFWEHSNLYTGAGHKAMARLLGIIRMDNGVPPDEWTHVEEEKYGIGKVRSLQKFFDTFGIHRETQTVEPHLCRFVGRKMQKAFKPHLRKDRMGINYDEIDFEFKDPAPNEKPPPLNGARGRI